MGGRERETEKERGKEGIRKGGNEGERVSVGEEVRGVCGVGGEKERKVKREEKGREGESRRRGNG